MCVRGGTAQEVVTYSWQYNLLPNPQRSRARVGSKEYMGEATYEQLGVPPGMANATALTPDASGEPDNQMR